MPNGQDNFTPNGPVFDNAYHDFLINTIVENDAISFAGNTAPFNIVFPDWFADTITNGVSHLGKCIIELIYRDLDITRHNQYGISSALHFAANKIRGSLNFTLSLYRLFQTPT